MSREQGSGTVLWLGVIGVLLAVTAGLAALGSASVASHQARAAADAAALAGAAEVLAGDPGQGCLVAARIAAQNHAELLTCQAGTEDLQVTVQVQPGLDVGLGAARATARAGDPALRRWPG